MLEMVSPLAIFAGGLNAIVKNRNNEGSKASDLESQARTGSQDPLQPTVINDHHAAFVLS